MPVEKQLDEAGVNEGRSADEVDDKSEEENVADDLKCLDWLVNYRLPAISYNSTLSTEKLISQLFIIKEHLHTETNVFCNFNKDPSCEGKGQVATKQVTCAGLTEKRLTKKCSQLCWIYRVLATSPERQLSLNDICHRFIDLNHELAAEHSSNWKIAIGETLLISKCFVHKHSLWSINANFALKHEPAALAQGVSHHCPPPSISSTYEVVRTSKKNFPVMC